MTAGTVDARVLIAAAIAAGDPPRGAADDVRALADEALAVADRHAMDDIVEHLAGDHVPSGRPGPRVSDHGTCRRAVWYRESPPDGFAPDPRAYDRHAALGTLIHAAAAKARASRYPWRWHEFELAVPGLDRPAKVDEYDPVLGEVSDLKSAGVRRWEQVGEHGPAGSAWGQVAVYALALDGMGAPVRTLRIMTVNRDNGSEEHFRRDYDPASGRAALDDLLELATMLEIGAVPPRDGTGPATDWRCRACFARSHCWNVPAAAEAGRSPESYTTLGADPDADAVIWAAGLYLAAKAARAAAEAAEKEARELLRGVPPGEYGDVVVTASRRDMPDYKASFERLLELYALSEAHRPPADLVAGPVMRVDRYTTVRRKRKAARRVPSGTGGTR